MSRPTLPPDPWTTPPAEAKALCLAEGRGEVPEGWTRRWVRAQNVTDTKPAIEAGDGFALLWAVAECLDAGLVAPDWLARAFRGRFDLVANFQVGTWDEAFGKPFPGKRVDVLRAKRKIILEVYFAVEDRLDRGEKTAGSRSGGSVFDAVGEEFGMSGGDIRKLYYAQRNLFRRLEARNFRLTNPGEEPPKPKYRKGKA